MPESPEPKSKKKHHHPRHAHRSRSHESAHANHDQHRSDAIPDHPLIPRNTAVVDTQAGLESLIEKLRNAERFAYDSEFIGELSYHPRICLIQTATPEGVWLIDPLKKLDLSSFWDLIADRTVQKLVHAGQQDLEPVYRLIGRPAANVFDVQIAAGFSGLAYPAGLSKLVREILGVHLGKGFTFTHWDQRPLSAVQLRYAADDVRYLPAMHEKLVQTLGAMGHLNWASEESEAMCNPALYQGDPTADWSRIRGVSSLSGQSAAVLRELYIWREQAAKRYDLPPRSYLRDEIILEMSRKPVRGISDLPRVRGLPKPVEQEEGQNIVEASQRGLHSPDVEQLVQAQRVEETPAERFDSDALWSAVQAWCYGRKIDPSLVASRQEVVRWLKDCREQKATVDAKFLHGWRREMIGSLLTRALRGEEIICLGWKDGTLYSDSR